MASTTCWGVASGVIATGGAGGVAGLAGFDAAAAGGGAGVAAGGLEALGAGGPQPIRPTEASSTTAGSALRTCSSTLLKINVLLHEIPEAIQIGLEFPGDDPSQDGGFHQRC